MEFSRNRITLDTFAACRGCPCTNTYASWIDKRTCPFGFFREREDLGLPFSRIRRNGKQNLKLGGMPLKFTRYKV